MASLSGFDANKVEPLKAFAPLPAGKYKAAVVASEHKRNKANTGSYVSLELAVLEGDHKSRKLYVTLNLDHPNKQAVEIARSELSAICRAVGVLTPNDSAELHNRPFWAEVKLEKRKDNGEMQNRIKGYESLAAAANAAATAPVAAADCPW